MNRILWGGAAVLIFCASLDRTKIYRCTYLSIKSVLLYLMPYVIKSEYSLLVYNPVLVGAQCSLDIAYVVILHSTQMPSGGETA